MHFENEQPLPTGVNPVAQYDGNGLRSTSNVGEVVYALGTIGLDESALAEIIETNEATVRRWKNGGHIKVDDRNRLDDLRFCFQTLIHDGKLRPRAAVQVMLGNTMLKAPFKDEVTITALKKSPDEVVSQVFDYAMSVQSRKIAKS